MRHRSRGRDVEKRERETLNGKNGALFHVMGKRRESEGE